MDITRSSPIFCRYGERDFQDLMEAVDKALEAFPELDKERAAVMGGSYGGYMTNWIITHTSRFKAAITQRLSAIGSLCILPRI